MEFKEYKGKNVDEAITNACIDLGIEAAKLEYEVIEKGSNGFLGIGSKPAIIKAKKNQSVEDIAREFLNKVFTAMELTVKIDIKIVENEKENIVNINIIGEDMGILIGKRGQTLDSLQYLVSLVINKESEKFQFFNQVFAGSMPFGECLEQGKQLGIEISAEGYCVILFKIIMIDHPMDYNEDIVSATEDIENLSEQTEKLLWFRRGVEGWGFIAQGAVGEELTARAQTFREDLEKVLEKYKNLEYFGGIGSQVGRFSEIKRSYNDANRAFAERFSRSLRQFVSYSEVHQVGVQNDVEMHRLGTMAENRKMLERFLKTGTENEVKSFMDAYFDAIGEQNLQSMMLRQYIVMDTFISVQSLGDSLNIEKEDIERELGDVQEVSQYVQELEATRKYLENIVRRMIRLREQASGRRYSEIIEKARDYIGQNYMSENISLNLVASSVNISPSYFSSLFSQEVGSTFVEYLTGVRMEKAKELLMCSDKRTSDIGYEVGYKDSHYFSYIFKKTQGCSPKEFRSRGRG